MANSDVNVNNQAIIAKIGARVDEMLDGVPKSEPIIDRGQISLDHEPFGVEIATIIDHTLLKTEYTLGDVDRTCDEALEYHFASVCVNPIFVPRVVERLQGSSVKPASVVGFIFGADFPRIKRAQADVLIEAGARELDAVLAVGLLKEGCYREVGEDLAGVIQICHASAVVIKVILEVGLLTPGEKIAGALIARELGADYLKTCTGFAPGTATVEDIRLLREIAGDRLGVKAAGGVRSYSKALELVRSGASRLGATQGVSITQAASAAHSSEERST